MTTKKTFAVLRENNILNQAKRKVFKFEELLAPLGSKASRYD